MSTPPPDDLGLCPRCGEPMLSAPRGKAKWRVKHDMNGPKCRAGAAARDGRARDLVRVESALSVVIRDAWGVEPEYMSARQYGDTGPTVVAPFLPAYVYWLWMLRAVLVESDKSAAGGNTVVRIDAAMKRVEAEPDFGMALLATVSIAADGHNANTRTGRRAIVKALRQLVDAEFDELTGTPRGIVNNATGVDPYLDSTGNAGGKRYDPKAYAGILPSGVLRLGPPKGVINLNHVDVDLYEVSDIDDDDDDPFESLRGMFS